MAHVDLTVSEEERMTFNVENRPIWPRVPTSCPVIVCGERKYNKFKGFLIHWKQTHEQKNCVHVCSCGKKFATMKHLKAHLKVCPGHKAVADQIVNNINYVNPGEVLPYQLGNREDRSNMKDLQQHLASERRRAEANKFKEARELLYTKSETNICRDERVVERHGKLFKDINMCDGPKHSKRIKFEQH